MSTVRSTLCLFMALVMLVAGVLPAGADMTLKKEREIGEEAYREVMAQLQMVTDPDSVQFLREMGARIVSLIPNSPFKYTFNIVDAASVNAFAIPAGYVFIFRGLITFMDTEEELAAVVAHEVAHVKHRHLAGRVKRSKPLNLATLAGVLAGVLLGLAGGSPAIGQAVLMGSVAGSIQQQLAFSREDEAQADYSGYKLMTALGYSPVGMRESFAKIARHESMMGPAVATYLRSHPQSADRMDRIDSLIRRYGIKARPLDNNTFLRIRTRLIALYNPVGQARSTLKGQMHDGKSGPWPRYGLALVEMRSRNYDKALKLLSAMNPEQRYNPYVLRERALCRLRMGQMNRAADLYAKVLAKLPRDQEALFGLGQVRLHQNQLASATRLFRRLVAINPENDRGQHQLGVALGRLGAKGEASLHLGLAFKLRRNFRAARYHLGLAQRSADLKPELRAQAHKALKETKGIEKRAKKKQESSG